VPQKPAAFYQYSILCTLFLLTVLCGRAQNTYELQYSFVDTVLTAEEAGLQKKFANKNECNQYIVQLPELLKKKGFITSSIDSITIDTSFAAVTVFLGKKFSWSFLNTSSISSDLLNAAGYRDKNFTNKPLNYQLIESLQKRILDKLENTGYPFAKVYLDSFDLVNEKISAILKIDKGPLYKIDSIRVFGDAKISNRFLQRYLEIPQPSVYQKQKLSNISTKLLQLPYLVEEQRWDIDFLSTGSIVNLYLKNKRSSEINGLVGFLPATDQQGRSELLVTGDFNLKLKNNFGFGETLGLIIQRLQAESLIMQLGYEHPFLAGSPFGIDVGFDGQKRDSSFLNINWQVGVMYSFGGNKRGKIFYQQFITNLDKIDTNFIRFNRRLPDQIDQTTTNIGVDYEWFNTDYRFNPRKGNDIKLTASAGIRKIKPNNSITGLKDPFDPQYNFKTLYDTLGKTNYTFRVKVKAAKFFQTGKQTTLKTAVSAGIVQSPKIFRNELFQIGGFRLLRGFDEESIFVSAYAVATAEYRLLIGLNSYLYAFTDGAWVANNSQFSNTSNQFIGAGLGMAFQTKAGIFNIAFAAGKRDDLPLNLRQSKIHFGYINFF
jgi:outer membrane protein assembly factor BamA